MLSYIYGIGLIIFLLCIYKLKKIVKEIDDKK